MPHHLLPQRHSPSSARARKGPKYAHFEKKVQNLRILSPPFGIVFPGAMSQKWPPADIPPQVVASEKGRFLSGLRELLNNRKKRKSDLRPAKESNIKKAARAGRQKIKESGYRKAIEESVQLYLVRRLKYTHPLKLSMFRMHLHQA